ncbi:MAG: hypothetical protein KDD47_27585, partial [Acidobacteria bacterium]|nr:hypothetical protein [Acidobacteriota bacterium]
MGGTYSWARLEPPSSLEIQPGDRAILLDPGQTFRQRVGFLPEVAALLPSPFSGLDRGRGEECFLEAAPEGQCPDFLIGLG